MVRALYCQEWAAMLIQFTCRSRRSRRRVSISHARARDGLQVGQVRGAIVLRGNAIEASGERAPCRRRGEYLLILSRIPFTRMLQTSCKCLWKECSETYSSKRALSAHAENHARTPLVCAYGGKSLGAYVLECHILTCNSAGCDRNFKNGKLLLQHHELVHERGQGDHHLKRSMQLFKPNPDDLPCPPLPAKPLLCQHDTPPVQQCPITPQRHQTIGPKVRQIITLENM